MDELILQVKGQLTEAFNVNHRILTRMTFVEDMIMYCKFSVYLSNLQEDVGDFRNAVQTIRSAIYKVVEYREELLK
jgi:predicted transcriptional regulator